MTMTFTERFVDEAKKRLPSRLFDELYELAASGKPDKGVAMSVKHSDFRTRGIKMTPRDFDALTEKLNVAFITGQSIPGLELQATRTHVVKTFRTEIGRKKILLSYDGTAQSIVWLCLANPPPKAKKIRACYDDDRLTRTRERQAVRKFVAQCMLEVA